MSEIKLKKNENVERALKRLKRNPDVKNTLNQIRERRYYQKPSEKRRQQLKRAKFDQYLRSKEEKLWR